MTVSYHSGRRIQGTSTDFGTAGAGIPGVSGGWKELGRISGSRTVNNSLTVSSLENKRYYMILGESQGGATYTNDIRFNADSGSNYAIRQSVNGGTDGAYTGQAFMNFDGTGSDTDKFGVGYIANLSTKEKLYQSHVVQRSTAGAGNDPKRGEFAGKWANTSNAINSISMLNRGSGTSSAGELVVLGWDPADTHTTNFWEELASVSGTGSSSNLSTGTFTAKKYLWIQYYVESTSTVYSINRFNNDTTATYAWRNSSNGGADTTTVSDTAFYPAVSAANGHFCNMFIINNSANEKLVISNTSSQNTAGAATAPQRREGVTKWANTSSQITEMDIDASTGNWGANSIVKVWGSN